MWDECFCSEIFLFHSIIIQIIQIVTSTFLHFLFSILDLIRFYIPSLSRIPIILFVPKLNRINHLSFIQYLLTNHQLIKLISTLKVWAGKHSHCTTASRFHANNNLSKNLGILIYAKRSYVPREVIIAYRVQSSSPIFHRNLLPPKSRIVIAWFQA